MFETHLKGLVNRYFSVGPLIPHKIGTKTIDRRCQNSSIIDGLYECWWNAWRGLRQRYGYMSTSRYVGHCWPLCALRSHLWSYSAIESDGIPIGFLTSCHRLSFSIALRSLWKFLVCTWAHQLIRCVVPYPTPASFENKPPLKNSIRRLQCCRVQT